MSTHQLYTPGLRIEVRDAEWRIRRVDHSSDGGSLLTCEGLSEIVRGREGLFLTRLEEPPRGRGIRVLDPATTQLVDDPTSGYRASLLYIDTLLRKTPPTDGRIHVGQNAAMDQLPFQYDPALHALAQPRQRMLIADSVGLGKTLEAGILVSELIVRGRGKRILVLAVKSMLTQFQQEFWNRFTIPLVRLDSVGLQRVRQRIPSNHNPFHYFDRSIISIDTLKQDIEYRHYLEQAYWDIIIIDEAHNVAERGSRSQRARLAKLLATRSDALIMLSATPHDGKAESFASLMNMLDPTAIANPRDYSNEDFRDKGLVIRRFKADVRDQLKESFPEREIEIVRASAGLIEESAYEQLTAAHFKTLDGKGAGQLFRTVLEKALFSSPAACLSTIENRLKRLRARTANAEILADISTLEGLKSAISAIKPEDFSKYQRLLRLLRPDGASGLGWNPKDAGDRLVIFTESLTTLEFLHRQLSKDLGLKPEQLATLRGDRPDRELMETVEQFNKLDSPLRLLLCSDVASEGINLHHLSHRMIHFDIPWSLMVFQQRNGRIDRYGQQRQPQIRYLLTDSENQRVRGDTRVLEILIEKDNQAGRNIGDPSEFMRKFNPEDEEAITAAVIERDKSDDDDITDLFAALLENAAANDPLANFTPSSPALNAADRALALPLRLFNGDLSYAAEALRWLKGNGLELQADIQNDSLSLTAPADLAQRLRYLPPEIRPDHDRFVLTSDKQRIFSELKRCRDEESPWPDIQYLWELHPVAEWLADRALNAFGRHTAPVIRLEKLEPSEHIVLIYGGFPNKRGHVLVQDWLAVSLCGSTAQGIQPLAELLARIGLVPGTLTNRGIVGDTTALQALLPQAIALARQTLQRRRETVQGRLAEALLVQLDKLQELRRRHERQLELDFQESDQPEAFKQKKRDDRMSEIDRVFNDYMTWLDNTQTTEPDPFLQVVAVLTGDFAQ